MTKRISEMFLGVRVHTCSGSESAETKTTVRGGERNL